MKITNKKAVLLALALGLAAAQPAVAENIAWTDWTSATVGNPGVAAGTITPAGSGAIAVSYSGNLSFAQLATPCTDYWTEGEPKPYTGNAVVDNRPPQCELIATDLAGAKTITFNPPALNPILAILSMGRPDLPVSYAFDKAFTVLGSGKGYWNVQTGQAGSYEVVGNTLIGRELHGVIQFQGLITSITWNSSPNEYWHGITVGLPDQTLHVDINIHPNSDPNPLNMGSGGSTPVAIFGSATFNVYDIDTSTLKMGDAKVKVVGKKSNELCSYEDIGSYDETYFDNLNPVPDGYYDLLCKFDTYDIFQTANEGEVLEVLITGSTTNGTNFEGSDFVKIVKSN
jgi:hypothetical protein